MEIKQMTDMLYSKDTSHAYKYLLDLEELSKNENLLYKHFDMFLEMTDSDKYVIRVRGFRLLCKQAKWDSENKINAKIDNILSKLDDEKPTAVRQKLKALQDVIIYKKNLSQKIKENVLQLDYLKYKESMQGLIQKDINELVDLINSNV